MTIGKSPHTHFSMTLWSMALYKRKKRKGKNPVFLNRQLLESMPSPASWVQCLFSLFLHCSDMAKRNTYQMKHACAVTSLPALKPPHADSTIKNTPSCISQKSSAKWKHWLFSIYEESFSIRDWFWKSKKKKKKTKRCKYSTEYKCSVEDLAIWWLW